MMNGNRLVLRSVDRSVVCADKKEITADNTRSPVDKLLKQQQKTPSPMVSLIEHTIALIDSSFALIKRR